MTRPCRATATTSAHVGGGSDLTYGLLSTYPPTACGLATFTASLVEQLGRSDLGGTCRIVRVVEEGASPPGAAEVVADLVAGSADSRRRAVDALNATDVAIVQHEYGIFGGADGAEVLYLLDSLTVPVIVVLHTVLLDPTDHQRAILEAVADAADVVVTMTHTARRRLGDYDVDPAKVTVIPHGAHVLADDAEPVAPPDVPTILTWGLLGPGKGIEWGIEALALLGDLEPSPKYLIVGKTHPKVLEGSGEHYRQGLEARAAELGVTDDVEFDASYLDVPALQEIVRRATLVLLPYDSPDQITSGVLIEAVAAGRPVVSTPFPHAVELLGGGVGLLVGHRDPASIAAAVRRVLTETTLREHMAGAAERLAPGLAWSAVAAGYRDLAEELVAARESAVA